MNISSEQAYRNHRGGNLQWAIALILLTLSSSLSAEEPDNSRLDLFGDLRLRMEQDWDSLNGDGTKRNDRLRLRLRLRAGLNYSFSEHWSTTIAVRSGPHLSQQSPHITLYDFDDGPDGPYEFNFDHWYLNYNDGRFEGWLGRNELSFWHQDDTFIFDNVTYPGIGGSYRYGLSDASLTWHANLVALPVGMRDFSGTGLNGQVVYEKEHDDAAFVIAGGYFGTWTDPNDPDGELLLTENGQRDYRVFNVDFQYRAQALGKPYQLGINYSRNFKDYDNAPSGSFSQFHKDEVNSYVFHMQWDELGGSAKWQLAYYYAHLEALGRHSSYIQDDWVRWGNANQARATNMKGSEFRAVYALGPKSNLFARFFLVDAIELLQPSDTTKETGNRFRIDWNINF